MSAQIISIIGLVLIFLIATLRSINMGAVAFLATFVIGVFVFREEADDLFDGFPGSLFVVLAGITFLFAIAKSNGTIDWLIHTGVKLVRGRIALIPWVMFTVTALLTMVGAVVPGAVAIMAPVGLNFAVRYRINPMLMGLLIINGASAGGFSPISIFGSITNDIVESNGLPGNPILLWLSSFVFNLVLSIIAFFIFGGKRLLSRQIESGTNKAADSSALDVPIFGSVSLDSSRVLTLVGILGLIVGAFMFDSDLVGLLAISIATVLSIIYPQKTRTAVAEIAWPTVLLICGVVTYVALMQQVGTIEFLGNGVAKIGIPLLTALLICFIGAAVSAFVSTTGILGALIPLAIPFLLGGQIGAVGVIIALAISSSVVDSSPFSTSGALVVAGTPEARRDNVFRGLMTWGMSMIIIAPIATWVLFVIPGWL